MSRLKPLALCLALATPLATPALADPTVGIGLNIVFGGSQGADVGVGLRVFSDNRRDEVAGTLGLDYMFSTNSFRGSLGAAYMFDNGFVGGDVGFDFGSGAVGFGVSGGVANTEDPAPVTPPQQDPPIQGDVPLFNVGPGDE
jgi:hypothetical protein